MKIQVLGSGCATCKKLHKEVEEVVENLNLDLVVEYSDDIAKIAELGAMSSPVFAINDELITSGNVPGKEEIEKAILEKLKHESSKINRSDMDGCCCCGKC